MNNKKSKDSYKNIGKLTNVPSALETIKRTKCSTNYPQRITGLQNLKENL